MLKLRVSDIKQFVYCPRILYFTYVLPVDKKVTRKMTYGQERHVELDCLEKRRKLKRYNLAEGERKFHTHLYSPRLGLEGKLDLHIICGQEFFPVEFKNTLKGPGLNHKYQLTAYAMLLEDVYRRPVRYGFIYLIPTGTIHELEITPNMRQHVKEIMTKIRCMVKGQSMPGTAIRKQRCVDCEYRKFCGDVI
ncbi:MAG: CRISPR-associated protein Cas4 [Clostridia bacterium]|nr:CRISPR-associated protein Cas4 [Clostridia bacterium]